jgi:hypothetical protein
MTDTEFAEAVQLHGVNHRNKQAAASGTGHCELAARYGKVADLAAAGQVAAPFEGHPFPGHQADSHMPDFYMEASNRGVLVDQDGNKVTYVRPVPEKDPYADHIGGNPLAPLYPK